MLESSGACPLSKFIKFGPLKRRFPVNSTDWKSLVDKLHENGERLLKIASVDAIIAVGPVSGQQPLQFENYFFA